MASQQETLDKIKELFKLVSESLTQKDFLDAFRKVTELVLDSEIKMTKRVNTLLMDGLATLQNKFESLSAKDQSDMAQMKADCMSLITQMLKEQQNGMSFIYDKMRKITQPKDGHTPTNEELLALITPLIPQLPEMPEETPQVVRDKLETLEGDERLDKSAIKGIEKIENDIKEIQIRPTGGKGGSRGFSLYVGGSKKLLTAQTLNLIAGTGMTLTYNFANGRNDITFSSTGGGGGFSILTPTGTIDGSNKVFTFASAPSIVILNGASYRDGGGVTIASTTVTFDVAPATGSDLYALG